MTCPTAKKPSLLNVKNPFQPELDVTAFLPTAKMVNVCNELICVDSSPQRVSKSIYKELPPVIP